MIGVASGGTGGIDVGTCAYVPTFATRRASSSSRRWNGHGRWWSIVLALLLVAILTIASSRPDAAHACTCDLPTEQEAFEYADLDFGVIAWSRRRRDAAGGVSE